MLKLLIISQHFPPDQSGNASRIYDMSKKLVNLGCDVIVISPFPSFPHAKYTQKWKLYDLEKIEGITHLSIFSWNPTKSDPSFSQRAAYYLIFPFHAIFWTLINGKNFDIIISTSPPVFTGLTGIFIKKFQKKSFVYDVRDLWIQAAEGLGFTNSNSTFTKLTRKYEKYIYKYCDLITVTTNHIKNKIIQENDIDKSKIHIIPNGVDTNKFDIKNKKYPRIIYTGNIGYAQDLKKVIDAVERINKKTPLKFLIVGNGDIKKSLESYVKKRGLEDIIIFTDIIDRKEIPNLLSECIIGIAPLKNIPSLRYALPTKVYEYMAAGLPFIATGKGEIEILSKKSEAGIVAENTVVSIQNQIENLMKDEEKLKIMGENGKSFATKYADRGKIAEKFYKILEGLL